jgi:hypothetical protein
MDTLRGEVHRRTDPKGFVRLSVCKCEILVTLAALALEPLKKGRARRTIERISRLEGRQLRAALGKISPPEIAWPPEQMIKLHDGDSPEK